MDLQQNQFNSQNLLPKSAPSPDLRRSSSVEDDKSPYDLPQQTREKNESNYYVKKDEKIWKDLNEKAQNKLIKG